MTVHFYNHEFHNFLAKKNEQMLAKNAVSKPFVTYYKRLQALTQCMREALTSLIKTEALATCHVAHITKTLLVISTPHTSIAGHLKTLDSLILSELKLAHEDFKTIQTLHISVLEHERLRQPQ